MSRFSRLASLSTATRAFKGQQLLNPSAEEPLMYNSLLSKMQISHLPKKINKSLNASGYNLSRTEALALTPLKHGGSKEHVSFGSERAAAAATEDVLAC